MRSLIYLLSLFSFLTLIGKEARLEFLQERCNKIIEQIDPAVQISVALISLSTGELLYEKNSQLRMVPASTTKVYTTAAMLDKLGSDYTFETQLWITGAIDKGTLRGSLIVKASGDPSFKERDLKKLLAALSEQGIERIEGLIQIDATAFDEIVHGPGWMWDDMPTSFCPPLSGFNINHGLIPVWIETQGKMGQMPALRLGGTDESLRLENRAVIAEKNEGISVRRVLALEGQPVEISGSVKQNGPPLKYKIPVINPLTHGAHLVVDNLQQMGIAFKGRTVFGKKPSDARLIAEHRSDPLNLLSRRVLKNSDNFYADAFFKKLGQQHNGRIGTWASGSQAVRDFITKRVQLDANQMILLDGSGLSRYNLTSTHQLTSLLQWIDREAPYKDDFQNALALSGIDGTLKERLSSPRYKGRIQAKTGAMTGISAICGYLTTKEKERLAFAIISNGFVSTCREMKKNLEDPLIHEWVSLPRAKNLSTKAF